MRFCFLFSLLILVSCSTSTPVRKVASLEALKNQNVDLLKSHVQLFPAIADADGLHFHFYLQLRNVNGELIDCDPEELMLKTSDGHPLPFEFMRQSEGRYYLTLSRPGDIHSSELDVFYQDRQMRKKLKIQYLYPDKKRSSIKMVSESDEEAIFQLKLNDRNNRPVTLNEMPEIILDGEGSIENLRPLGKGLWEFSLMYPGDNQIFYFSVRAQDIYLEKIYRYQHVEK